MNSTQSTLQDHFNKLKDLIPEVYSQKPLTPQEKESAALYEVLKRSLRIIEAVYLQDRDMFHTARIEEYGRIIEDLKKMGYTYKGNQELLDKAAGQLIMAAKKPMEKAKGSKGSAKSKGRKAM